MIDEEQTVYIAKRHLKNGRVAYHLRWVDPQAGKWKSKKAGTDRKRAERAKHKLEEQLRQGIYQELRPATWADFVDEHARLIRGEVHARIAERVLTDFGERLEIASPKAVTFQMIEAFAEHLAAPKEAGGKGYKLATVNKTLRYVRGALNMAMKRGYIGRSPMEAWTWTREDEKIPRIASDKEEAALLAAAKELFGLRWETFIRAALDTGGRRSEVLKLTWDRIDLDAKRILFTETKGKKDRPIPIEDCPELVDMLRRLHIQTQRHGGPFTGMGDIGWEWNQIRRKAGVLDVTIHDLRRTFVTRLVRAGVPLPTVQKLAGHANIHTTLHYYNAVTDDDLREGMKKLKQVRAG